MSGEQESTLRKVARLVGGVVLLQGRLGHQVLGQLLILDATDLEVAGASLVVAANAGQENALAQAAVRTVAPALAARGLLTRTERRLLRLSRLQDARERALDAREAALRAREAALAARERAGAGQPPGAVPAAARDPEEVRARLAGLRRRLRGAGRSGPGRR